MGRNRRVLERQHHLAQPCEAGGRLAVTDVRLDRADRQHAVAVSIHGRERLDLDRITERGAGAVAFDVADLLRRDRRGGERGADHSFLRAAVWHRQPGGAAVLVDRRPADHRANAITVGDRVFEALEHDGRDALRPRVAVGPRVERLAASVRREHAGAGRRQRQARMQKQIRAADDRGVAAAVGEASTREVEGDEGRGARGVEGHRRAFEPKRIADAPGGDAVRRPECKIRIGMARSREQRVVHRRHADPNAHRLAA